MSQGGTLNESNSTPVGQGRFPITPYVVGPVGQAGYQTIQSAINAANAAGGGMVFVQSGTYTENLTNFDKVFLFGNSESGTIISGTHTLPASGVVNFNRIAFTSAANIFNSAVAGSTQIIMEDCSVNVTNGYTFNLPNWTGQIQCFNIGNIGTNDGFINNAGGATVYLFEVGAGNGTVNSMILSGTTLFAGDVQIGCPISLQTGANFTSVSNEYLHTLTFSNNSTAVFFHDTFSTGATPAITQSSTGTIGLSGVVISSSNSPAITGAGVGAITLNNCSFSNSSSAANTLNVISSGSTSSGEVRAGSDSGGAATYISLTNTSSPNISTGTGTVKMSSASNANNDAWIKIYIGTTAHWIPAWTTNAP